MTDQQHERCECGREAKASTGNIGTSVSCKGDGQLCCWWGPTCANKFAAWAEWDRVMRAVRVLNALQGAGVDNSCPGHRGGTA